MTSYRKFAKGEKTDYIIPNTSIAERLDVKNCLGDTGRRVGAWVKAGYKVSPLKAMLTQATGRLTKVDKEEDYCLLKVTYDGEVMEAETKTGEELSYAKLNKVKAWDILFSNMGVGRGAVGIVPIYLEGKFVSNEYTILTAGSNEEALFYTSILRTKEILGDILTSTTGMNRGRIRWSDMGQINVPVYDKKAATMAASVRSTNASANFEAFSTRIPICK